MLEYMALPENSREREVIEVRYGRANLRRLVAKYQEDLANKKWMDEATMACPGCRIKVEKSHGCNHVCRSPFSDGLWVVLTFLAADDLRQMWSAFLLQVWRQDTGVQSIPAFFYARPPVLLKVVRLPEHRGVAADRRLRRALSSNNGNRADLMSVCANV